MGFDVVFTQSLIHGPPVMVMVMSRFSPSEYYSLLSQQLESAKLSVPHLRIEVDGLMA